MMKLEARKASRSRLKAVFRIKDAFDAARLRIQFLLGCLAVVRNPYDTDRVILAAQGMATPERFAEAQAYIRDLPGGAEILDGRPRIEVPDLHKLIKLPVNILGYAYAKHMFDNKLDPNFYDLEFDDELSYSFYRYGKVHDIWHVVAGFDTSVKGGIGILTSPMANCGAQGLCFSR